MRGRKLWFSIPALAVAVALTWIGFQARFLSDWLSIESLKSRDPERRRRAIAELDGRGDRSVRLLVSALAGLTERTRVTVYLYPDEHEVLSAACAEGAEDLVHALADSLPGASRPLEQLLPATVEEDWYPRYLAATFCVSAFVSSRAVPSLIDLLDDEAKEVREAAAGALSTFGRDASAAAPQLVALLDREREVSSVKDEALRALGKLGVESERVVTALERVMREPDELRRALAIEALWGITGKSTPLVKPAIDLLHDGLTRSSADRLLREFGASAVPELTRELQSAPVDVVFVVLELLADARAPSSVPAIGRLLSHESPEVRMASVQALRRFERAAAPAIAELEEVVRNEDFEVELRRLAVVALSSIGREALATLEAAETGPPLPEVVHREISRGIAILREDPGEPAPDPGAR